MLNCRLIYKFILITLITIVMQTSGCSAGCASDGGGAIPPPKIPDTSAEFLQKAMKPAELPPEKVDASKDIPLEGIEGIEKPAEKPEVQPEKIEEKSEVEKLKEEVKPSKKVIKSEPVEGKSFLGIFLDMFANLLKIIILILLIYAGILLYKRLKEQRFLGGKPETEEKIPEPQTISEAVSSYVRHKLKKA